MDDSKRLFFEQFLSPPGTKNQGQKSGKAEDYKVTSDEYVGRQNPYDRLRRTLRTLFPGYPDLFDINGMPKKS
jgi:hypothetical protein